MPSSQPQIDSFPRQGDAPLLVLVSDDLMFPSRVREALKPLGYNLRVAATEAALREAVSGNISPLAVFVNLTARRYDPLEIITSLKESPATRGLPVLAFAGHVEKDKHAAARAAGADMVAANSSVSLHLPILLSRLLSGERSSADVEEVEG